MTAAASGSFQRPPRLPLLRGLTRLSLVLGLGGALACEKPPQEPSPTAPASAQVGTPPSPKERPTTTRAPAASADSTPAPSCLVPLPDAPPPQAQSVESCPPDPHGRPNMPLGRLRFPEAPQAPELRVELALEDSHRAHGLMFRPELTDKEGMLFSWKEEQPRSFWMRNTCLALDMLFLDERGVILGILEQVPPMNEAPRQIPCPAAHVLEVRAGWSRTYGVTPGQQVEIISPYSPQ